jgi:hypothetical protein
MANAVFSPRDFKAYVIEEATPGTAPAITAGLHQLDVDSVAFPSLSPNQVTAVRSRGGRVLHADDFFQDNEIRAIEVSLSGTFRADEGIQMLLQSVTGMDLDDSAIADITMATAPTGKTGKYGVAQANATFSLVLASPDVVDGYNIIMKGCQCTSFSINADMTADGGLYKFEATISSGQNPETDNTDAPSTSTGGSDIGGAGSLITLTTLASSQIFAVASPVISSFGFTIESPAIYTGFSSSGYHSFARGNEFTVSANATVKYDLATRGLYNSFNTQTEDTASNLFVLTQAPAGDCSISLPAGVLTDVTFNEGDAMMLDVAMQGVTNGSDAILTIDLT